MTRVLPIIVALTLAVYALIDCIQTDPAEVRGPRRAVWILLILLIPIIGPVAWLIARWRTPHTGQSARRPTTPPVAPDDNPEFLRQLPNIDEEHEKLLSQWETDQRRREEEMRNRDGDDDESS